MYQLILRSADIPSYDNNGNLLPKYANDNYPSERINTYEDGNYSINVSQSYMTFKNVNLNLRSLLMNSQKANKYYKMRVNSITFGLTSGGQVLTSDERDRTFNIQIEGLNFMSSQQNGSYYSNKCIIASIRIASGGVISYFSYVNRDFSFMISETETNYKPNISIVYTDLETGQIKPSGTLNCPYPNIQISLSFMEL